MQKSRAGTGQWAPRSRYLRWPTIAWKGRHEGASRVPMMTMPVCLIPDPQGKRGPGLVPRLYPDAAFAVSLVLELLTIFAPSLKEPPFPATHDPVILRHGQLCHPSHSGHAIPADLPPLPFHRPTEIHPSTTSDIKKETTKGK